jgi:hypothetical protein
LHATSQNPETTAADAVRLQNGVKAITDLADAHLPILDQHIEFIYLFVPLLPFGEPSSRFKIGVCGATVRFPMSFFIFIH